MKIRLDPCVDLENAEKEECASKNQSRYSREWAPKALESPSNKGSVAVLRHGEQQDQSPLRTLRDGAAGNIWSGLKCSLFRLTLRFLRSWSRRKGASPQVAVTIKR